MIIIIIKIIYNFHPFENCACIILTAVTRVNLPFCHKSMTVVCEVGPQRCVMGIKNKNEKHTFLYMYICIITVPVYHCFFVFLK